MPDFDLYTLEEDEITISNGAVLSGFDQGTGVHLLGETITLNSNNFQVVTVTDNEDFFADNDGNQSLTNAVTYNGVTYPAGTDVEAEYTLTVEDPDGNTYTLIGFNINESNTGPDYGTVEGLAFLGDFPPVGVPLTVVANSEGPTQNNTLYNDYFVPPCFTEGTRIDTPDGPVAVEDLRAGDLVLTLDHGAQPVRWVGHVTFTRQQLQDDTRLRPVLLEFDGRRLIVSPQHRVFFGGWSAQMACGEDVLVSAKHIAEAGRARVLSPEEIGADGVRYWHILFDRHEVVFSEGIPTESFCPGQETRASLPDAHAEFERFFPALQTSETGFVTARRCATRHEARLVAEAF